MPSSVKKKENGFTIVKPKNGKKSSGKSSVQFQDANTTTTEAKEAKFVTKVRANFLPPADTKDTAFHVVAALKGLTTAIFTSSPGSSIKSRDGKSSFDKLENFPKTESIKTFFEVEHQRRSGKRVVTVVFTMATEEKFGDVKFGALLAYLQRNKIYLDEHRFETNEIAKVGIMTMQHPVFVNFDHFKHKVHTTLNANLAKIRKTGESMDKDVQKYAESGQAIPPFELKVARAQNTSERKGANNQVSKERLEVVVFDVLGEIKHLNTLRMLFLVLTQDEYWNIGHFIPYSWGRQHPEAFRQGLLDQKEFMDTTVKFPVFNVSPKILAGLTKGLWEDDTTVDSKAAATGEEEDSLKSALTEAEPITVEQYACRVVGNEDEPDNPYIRPLIYSVEPTTKSETEGLYFIITHKDYVPRAMRFMETEFIEIYTKSSNYAEVTSKEERYKMPHVGSYQGTSDRLAKEMLSSAEPSTQSSWATKTAGNKRKSQSIVIDYEDFPDLTQARPQDNFWATKATRDEAAAEAKEKKADEILGFIGNHSIISTGKTIRVLRRSISFRQQYIGLDND